MKNPLRSPLTSKRALREKSAIGKSRFALTADVSEARKQVLIHQVQPGSDVFVRAMDTFGVASASFYWSCVARTFGRHSQYLVGNISLARGVFWCRTIIISKPRAQSIAEH